MGTDVKRHRFTVEEYHQMGRAGIFHEDDRVELIEGEIVEMSPIGSRHAACVKRLNRLFSESSGDHAVVSVQDPVRIDAHSELQPDVALLRPRRDDYESGHPGPEDVLLLIEVAETSGRYDREVKLPLFARAGISEVWIVDLGTDVVDVHRVPSESGYQRIDRVQEGQTLTPEAFPELQLTVDEIVSAA